MIQKCILIDYYQEKQSLSNVTIRDTTIMHESIDDLIDLMETHNEIVELFENDPILSQQSQRINL